MPIWLYRANRRHRLLSLGISLSEQLETPAYELDAIIAVDNAIKEWQADEQEKANRG